MASKRRDGAMRFGVLIPLVIASSASAAPPQPPKLFPPNRLHTTSYNTDQVKSFRADGAHETTFDGGGLLDGPETIAFGPDGRLYVSCAAANVVRAIDADDVVIDSFDGGGVLSAPNGIAFGPLGHLVVASRGNDRVYFIEPDDTVGQTLGAGTTLDSPRHVAFSPDGVLHVASYGTSSVFRFGIGGGWLGSMSPVGLDSPIGVAFSPAGRLLVSSSVSDDFVELSKDVTGLWFDDAMLETPYGIAVGPDHRVYVAADASGSVLRFSDGAVDKEIGWFEGLFGVGGVAFSPFYFSVRLRGKLYDHDGATVKRSGKAMLGFAPGSGRVTLSFTDDPDKPFDLASMFAGPVVLQGQEGGSGNTRSFVGTEIPGPDKHYRTTIVNLKIVGNLDDDGFYVVKDISGSIARTGMNDGSEVFKATIETIGRLN